MAETHANTPATLRVKEIGTMPESDASLVGRARKGDAEAYETLVRRYLRTAHAVAFAVLGETADAQDTCQDAFITALERLDDCRDPERFGAWLLQIVRNRAHNVRRYHAVRSAVSVEDISLASDGASPARSAERKELREQLTQALAQLSPVQREVVLLHDLEGWRHREIAEVLELPEGTVRAHLFHARRFLRPLLSKGLSVEEG